MNFNTASQTTFTKEKWVKHDFVLFLTCSFEYYIYNWRKRLCKEIIVKTCSNQIYNYTLWSPSIVFPKQWWYLHPIFILWFDVLKQSKQSSSQYFCYFFNLAICNNTISDWNDRSKQPPFSARFMSENFVNKIMESLIWYEWEFFFPFLLEIRRTLISRYIHIALNIFMICITNILCYILLIRFLLLCWQILVVPFSYLCIK